MAKTDLTIEKFLDEARKELKQHADKLLLKDGSYGVPVHFLGDWQEAADDIGYKPDIWFSEKDDMYMTQVDRGPNTVTVPADVSEVASEVVSEVEKHLGTLNDSLGEEYPESEFTVRGRGTSKAPYEIMFIMSPEDAKKLQPPPTTEARYILSKFRRDYFSTMPKPELVETVAKLLTKMSVLDLQKMANKYCDQDPSVAYEVCHEAVSTFSEMGDDVAIEALNSVATADLVELKVEDLDNGAKAYDSQESAQVYSLDGGQTPMHKDIHAYARMVKKFDGLAKPYQPRKDLKCVINVITDVSGPDYWFNEDFDGWYAYPSISVPAEAELDDQDVKAIQEKLSDVLGEIRGIVEDFLTETANHEKFAVA